MPAAYRALGAFLHTLVAADCGGDSPVGPTDPKGPRLTNMTMSAYQMQGFVGPPPYQSPLPLYTNYLLCGSVGLTPGASEQLVIRTWEVTITNPDGTVLLTWADSSMVGTRIGLGLAGCFGGPIDEIPGRAAGSGYRFRLTYYGGGNGAVETSGPVTSR
jgi:hypothetical protein